MDPDKVQQQLERLCDPTLGRDDVFEAHETLRRAGPAVENLLVGAVRDGTRSAEARSRIASVLGDLQSSAAIPAILDCLGEASVHLRWHAVRALGKIGDASAIPELTRIAQEDTGELALQPGFTITVRDAARAALAELNAQDRRRR